MRRHTTVLSIAFSLALLLGACVTQSPARGTVHRWWAGLGPVLPHDTFPADCKLCHVGEAWNSLRTDFSFDHATRTGVPLEGAHKEAMCLRCHNDRGPVEVFQSRGCAGCHEDPHAGKLGPSCATCHTEKTWEPTRQIEQHNHRRFPLTGAHAVVACHRCHVGAQTGSFAPTSTECLSCHVTELNNTTNPPHLGLGWTDNCQRCHMPTRWEQARVR